MMRWLLGTGCLLAATVAHAYVGPGLGVGVLGAMLGLLVAIVMAVIGTIWYPLKRLFRGRSQQPGSQQRGGAVSPAIEPAAESALHLRDADKQCESR
jgi:hypothetical protein